MQSLYRSLTRKTPFSIVKTVEVRSTGACLASSGSDSHGLAFTRLDSSVSNEIPASRIGFLCCFHRLASLPTARIDLGNVCSINVSKWSMPLFHISTRSMATVNGESPEEFGTDVPPRIKFKRPDKTARHIMQILDKEAVEEVKSQREIPDIKPGYIVQLKVVVPENKRRASIVKGIVIARRNAGLNTTFRLRRQVAGVGVESLYPLYSPNIKEIKVLDKKKVRRAKLYYLRDKMNALKK